MHMMLVARCIERIGDNAVDIGEQTAFVVTGLFREFKDASHPELSVGGSPWRASPRPTPRACADHGVALRAAAGRRPERSRGDGLLSRLIARWPDEEGERHDLVDLEHRGDKITHDIIHHLYRRSATPFDRADLLALALARGRRGRLRGGGGGLPVPLQGRGPDGAGGGPGRGPRARGAQARDGARPDRQGRRPARARGRALPPRGRGDRLERDALRRCSRAASTRCW